MANKTALERVFEEVILGDDWNESIDALDAALFSLENGKASKRADYLVLQRQIIIETKSITGDRSRVFNDWLNAQAEHDRWLQRHWFGEVRAEDLFGRHPKGAKLKRQATEYFFRSVLTNAVQGAKPQLRDTKRQLHLPDARCGVALLNGADDSYEAKELQIAIANHLAIRDDHGRRKCGPIDFVLMISKTPADVAARNAHISLIFAPDLTPDESHGFEWYFMKSFPYRWATHTGSALLLND